MSTDRLRRLVVLVECCGASTHVVPRQHGAVGCALNMVEAPGASTQKGVTRQHDPPLLSALNMVEEGDVSTQQGVTRQHDPPLLSALNMVEGDVSTHKGVTRQHDPPLLSALNMVEAPGASTQEGV